MAFPSSVSRVMQLRLLLFKLLVLVAFGALFARLFHLQILRGEIYKEQAEGNRIRSIPLEAPRGVVLDRHGAALVRNEVSFAVAVIPDEVAENFEGLNLVIKTARLDRKKILDEIFKKERGSEYVFLKRRLSFREFAAISEILPLPGIYTFELPTRKYLHPLRDAHVLGYVGEISEGELKHREAEGLRPGDLVGRDGIEEEYDALLRGKNGAEELEVDAMGRLVRPLDEVAPIAGHDLHLTLDETLQETAWKALLDEQKQLQGRNGMRTPASAVALDPNNGEILAYVSWPTFDPNWFVRGMTQRQYDAILHAGFDPLLNRPIQAAHPCGSTFKLVTGAAGLEEKVISPDRPLYCPGYYHIPGLTFNCFVRRGHGQVKFSEAIALSCDAYFYQVGDRLGIDRLDRYAGMFGIGERTGVDLPGESSGLLPTPQWKNRVYHEDWYRAETINMSIGQGYLMVTPMQLAGVTEIVANGGTLWRPHLFKAADPVGPQTGRNGDADPVRRPRMGALRDPRPRMGTSGALSISPRYPENVRTLKLRQQTLALVRLGMKGAVDHGTATGAKLPRVTVAGKTGTAENTPTPLNPKGRNHAWFASFAPYEKPELVVVVMMEQSGGYGGGYAAPIAKKIFEAYFERAGKELSRARKLQPE